MAKEPENVIWTGNSVGVCIEQYNGNYSIKACKRFTSQGQEKVGYEWGWGQEYDKETKKWKPKAKMSPISVYLGDKQQTIDALHSMIELLSGHDNAITDDDIPF